MAVCFLLKEVIVFLCVVRILNAERDLLETIQLDASNPPELNEFLRNVLQEKQVFSWIRHAARDTDSKEVQNEQQIQQQSDYQNSLQPANIFNGKAGVPLKRNTPNRRLVNDVHPYMFESDNDEEEDEEEEEVKQPVKRSLRSKRRKQKRVSNYPRSRRSKGSVSLDFSNEQSSGEVKIAPRSETGVLNVPGQKYGSKRGIKRTCDDDTEVHEPVKTRSNTSKSNSTKNDVTGEYYFTTPHDVLGLDQDISNEYENHNGSCLTIKKSPLRRQNNMNVTPNKVPILPAKPIKSQAERQVPLQNQISPSQMHQMYQQPQSLQLQQPQALQMPKFQPQQQQQSQQPLVVSAQIPKYQMQQLERNGIHQHAAPYPITAQMTQNKSVNSVLATKAQSGNYNDPKVQDFVKLISFVDSSNKETSTMTKQDLLRRDNDDVLENIDRVLKSDRSGLNLFHDVPSGVRYAPHSKREDKDSQNYNGRIDLKKLPMKRSETLRKNRDVGTDEKRMNVDITLNAQPVAGYTRKKAKTKRRKVNSEKKTYPEMASEKIKLNYDTTPSKNFALNNLPGDERQTNEAQQQMISNPNLKIMENADDENDNNLKQTLKEYMNRQNQYNQGRQPEGDDEEQVTPDYQLVQEKKNMLEDQTEPTSAAEQRELGRKDEHAYVTPSLLNDTDDALIVIPLKKNVQNDNAITAKNGDSDFSREGFKVKEAKDVIHLRHHANLGNDVQKKDALEQLEGLDGSAFTKDVFNKVKNDIDQPARNEIKDDGETGQLMTKEKKKVQDYGGAEDVTFRDVIKEKDDKLEPEKQADVNYDDYENFDMKRDLSAIETNNFKSRKLNSISYSEHDYEDAMHKAKIRTKRDVDDKDPNKLDADDSLEKRSEDDEPDEEPGNDAKEPSQEEKKVQKSSKNRFALKKEEGEMTLHMDPSNEVKRNDSENDFPPDDENDGGGIDGSGNNTRKGSKTIISYNFFNITVNMATTTAAGCASQSYGNGTDTDNSGNSPDLSDSFQTDNNQTSDDISNQKNPDSTSDPKSDQIDRLAEDILNYAAKHKSKLIEEDDPTSKIQGELVQNEDRDISKAYDKETEEESHSENEENKRSNIKKPFRSNSTRKTLHNLEDFGNKYIERSSNYKHDDQRETEMNIKDQLHDSAVDNAKNREMLVNKLERLVNSYKSQIQPLIDSKEEGDLIDKRSDYKSDVVHHHAPKKKKAPIPTPECVTDKSGPMQKRVIKTEQAYVKPQEVYYEPESMADDLKEKLLFERIYNRVVRKRKKAPDPFMYKIIDSVFGNDEEIDEGNMCPVEFDDDAGDGIETPSKRTTGESKELTTTETDGDLIDISRQKKKTKNLEEVMERELHNSATSKSLERSNMIKKQINEEPKAKFDNVDSFKDVIELPSSKESKGIRKRELSARNLQDFPKSYLSPVNENFGFGRRRKRRRLKHLNGPLKKIRQINYNDYIQTHKFNNKRLSDRQQGSRVNFSKGQNYNVNERRSDKLGNKNAYNNPDQIQKGLTTPKTATTTTAPPKNVYKVDEKNCTEEDEVKVNQSKMIECELKKKEHEDMRRMLNGFLPLRIIDIFYNQLKEDSNLYSRFGGSIANAKQCASENSHNVKLFREEQAKVDIKHAEEMLHEVIIMLNQIVADQVHRRTCLQLAPNLKIFIIRITKNVRNLKKNYQMAEGYPLPKIKGRADEEIPMLPQEEDQGDFLFEKPAAGQEKDEKDDSKVDIHKKIKLIEKLLEKYQTMSSRCQVQVEPVKDYLLKHLGLLMKLLEKGQDSSTCATTTKDQEPLVKDEELSPPHGKVSIAKVNLNDSQEPHESSTMTTAESENDTLTQHSEVEQRQMKMLAKQREQQQILQKRLQNQENMEQKQQEQPSQDHYQLHPMQEGIFEQPHIRESFDGLQQQNDQNGRQEYAAPTMQQLGPPQDQSIQQIQTQQPGLSLNQTTQPANNAVTQTTTVAAIVTKELDPFGKHYSNPEMVSKNLLDMGLDEANTYIPPFDLNGMVQENVIKDDIAANAAGTLIPHVSAQSAPKPASSAPPKKREVLEQEKLYEKLRNAEDVNGNRDKTGRIRRPFKKSVTSRYNGRLMSKNQEMQDLLMTDLYSKQLFDHKRSINEAKQRRQAGNITQMQPSQTQPNNQPNQAQSKDGLANYGKDQFIFQPLVINPTQIPDPDIDDTEYYTGHKYSNPEMVNKDLVGMGLDGEVNSYIMPFTLDSVVQSQIKASTQNVEPKFPVAKPATELKKLRETEAEPSSHWNVSEKYKKLMDTYHNIREKRQNEERIGKLYGRKSIENKLDRIKSVNREMNDISKVSFEKPIVFSLEG